MSGQLIRFLMVEDLTVGESGWICNIKGTNGEVYIPPSTKVV